MLLEQLGSRLKDIGRASLHRFGPKELESIRKLQLQVEKAAIPVELAVDNFQEGDYRASIDPPQAEQLMLSIEFQSLVELLRGIKSATIDNSSSADTAGMGTLAFATLMIPVPNSPNPNILRFIADADYDNADAPNPVGNLFYSNSASFSSALVGETAADGDFRREDGQFLLSAGIPVKNPDGSTLAILALDYDAASEVNKVAEIRQWGLLIVAGSALLALLLAAVMVRLLNRPIRVLRQGVELVRRRDFSSEIPVTTSDELGQLARTFNLMVQEIKGYATNLEAINKAYERFVPKQFLEQLGQARITDVSLGDQVQKQMTVLFSDIRSFTSISESMSPRDNFDFINEFLRTMGPIIRRNGGFIDKYIGDAIMALFPENPLHAVRAALEMHHALKAFNEQGRQQGRAPVQIGVGLHCGNLMLGTVGEEQRMEGTVISDAVNLASRLEGLTKEYGAGIIASERVIEALPETDDIHLRYLGVSYVKGKAKGQAIYEVMDSGDADLQRRKIITRESFQRAVKAFEHKQYERAAKRLRKILKLNKKDKAAGLYLQRCEQAGSAPASTAGSTQVKSDPVTIVVREEELSAGGSNHQTTNIVRAKRKLAKESAASLAGSARDQAPKSE
jgi:class 3 adenylate cyclase/HAMP domain-containing protein